MDLNVYNPNIAKFGIARFDVEFLASGGAVATSSFKVQQLEMNPDKIFEDPDLLFMMICTCVLLSFNLWYFFLEVAELCQKGWKEYASDFWNYLEIINMTLLMISTGGLFYWRWEGFTLLETFDPARYTPLPPSSSLCLSVCPLSLSLFSSRLSACLPQLTHCPLTVTPTSRCTTRPSGWRLS